MIITKEELQRLYDLSMEGNAEDWDVEVLTLENKNQVQLYLPGEMNYPQMEGVVDGYISGNTGLFVFESDCEFSEVEIDWSEHTIKLYPSDLEAIYKCDGKYPFKGWYLEPNIDSGWFDSEKGAMLDFECRLYNDRGEYMGTGKGDNYYNNQGIDWHGPITFEIEDKEELNRDYLADVIDSNRDMDTKINDIIDHIKLYG